MISNSKATWKAAARERCYAFSQPLNDSAGYVELERVSGKLKGRTGTFILQHSSTMARGTQQQSIIVVPDSGADRLVGLAGSMIIKITDGKHFYEFDYTLPDKTAIKTTPFNRRISP